MKRRRGVVLVIFILAIACPSWAVEVAPSISDKEIIEKLGELKGDIKELRGEIKAVREELKGEINAVRQELKEEINSLRQELKGDIKGLKADIKRIEEGQRNIEHQIDRLVNIFIGIVAAFAAIVAITIGFAIWDRKTALQPAIAKSRELEVKEDKLERALKEFAKADSRMAEVLRNVGML